MIEAYKYKEAEPNRPSYYLYEEFDSIYVTALICRLWRGESAYYAGNIFKYIARAPRKNGSIDILKSRTYRKWLESVVSQSDSITRHTILGLDIWENVKNAVAARYPAEARQIVRFAINNLLHGQFNNLEENLLRIEMILQKIESVGAVKHGV